MSYAASLLLVLACAAKMLYFLAPGLALVWVIARLIYKSKSPAGRPGPMKGRYNR